MSWTMGNLGSYKQTNLARCRFLIDLNAKMSYRLGWVTESGSGERRLEGTIKVARTCGL